MNTLWTFGDSMTAGDGCVFDKPISSGGLSYYEEYKKEGDDIWPNHLAKKMNYKIKNCGISGASNDKIIDSIIDMYFSIKENDIVIIEKSFNQRFDIPNKELNVLQTQYAESLSNLITNYKKNKHNIENTKIETIINYAVYFSDDNLLKTRQDKRFNFLKNLIKNKAKICYIWDVIEFGRTQESIAEHTNGKIKDSHWSFNGHLNFSELLYEILFKKELI